MVDPIPDENQHINLSPGKKSSMDLTREYVGTLDREQIKKLVEIYEFDFEAFGYDPKEFLAWVKSDPWLLLSKNISPNQWQSCELDC